MNLTPDQVLARVPGELREPARHVLDWVLPDDDDLDALAAYDMLHFVWYQLPCKWMVDEGELAEVTAAAAAVMDAAGRHRVAELIRDGRTVQVQAAWRDDRREAVMCGTSRPWPTPATPHPTRTCWLGAQSWAWTR